MKVLLLIGGVLFLLLALLLFVAAAIVLFVSRSRLAKAAGDTQPAAKAAPRPQRPTPHAVPPPPPPPVVPVATVAQSVEPPDPDGTVVLNTRAGQAFGALHGVSGALAGRRFPIEASGFYIGRDMSQSQVVIENPSVSKRHVWIGARDGAAVAVDQQSTNGTYLNDTETRIGEVRLSPGDTLIISDDVARLQYRA